MELIYPAAELDKLESYFVDLTKKRLKNSKDGTLKLHRDAEFTENPMEREDVEDAMKVYRTNF